MNEILALALLLIFGYIAGRIMELLRVPAMIGYVLVGVLFGPPITNIINAQTIKGLDFIGMIALGLIAFIIGGRIEIKALKKLKENIIFLTLFQALATFASVSIGTYFICRSFPVAILLGAISSATAPATVFGVIEEYKAKGPLTKTLLAIVAIDDAICILLFGVVMASTAILVRGSEASVWGGFGFAFYEVLGSLFLGALIGVSINYIITKAADIHRIIFIVIGLVLLGCGLSTTLHFSELLTNMTAGFLIINVSIRAKEAFAVMEKVEEPILILFFALAGAHLQIGLIPGSALLVLGYVAFRWCGKVFGGTLGARIARAPKVVRKYVGLGLVPQAGVAIGLVYLVKARIPQLAGIVTAVILASIILDEIIGPIGVEIALLKSKEGKKPL